MPAQELVLAAGYGVGLPTASAASASYKPSANTFAGLQTVTDCGRLSQLPGFVVARRYASAAYAVNAVTVCLSVTFVNSVGTNKHILKFSKPF